MLIAFDGSPHAEQAISVAAAVMPGRAALTLTVWESVNDAAASTRIALPADVVAWGIAALDAEAHDEASRVAQDGGASRARRRAERRRRRSGAARQHGRDDRGRGRGA